MTDSPDVSAFRSAFEQKLFTLVFQPQVSISSGQLTGSEALLRWTSDEFGFVPPPEIISLAKKAGKMEELGVWILREACRLNHSWNEEIIGSPLTIAVNVSPAQFLGRGEAFREEVRNVLETTGLSPFQLELEITEEALIEDTPETRETLTALDQHGISIAMDDFGTGYSSLNYLAEIPFTKLKIDREFIIGLPNNKKKTKLVNAMIAMGSSLELEVLAEGVDEMHQLEHLRTRECDYYQGYLYGKPVSPDKFLKMIKIPKSTDE